MTVAAQPRPMFSPAGGGRREAGRVSVADVFECAPVLRTRRLVMRQITEADGEGLFGIFADPGYPSWVAEGIGESSDPSGG